jgi:phage replication-related protein YjqB (UPF0714/DUF867 family)
MDTYKNFTQLTKIERENIDFRIDIRRGKSNVAIIAPHGGKIEFGTSEIASAIADDVHCFYAFLGQKTRGNNELHITSTNFDEPACLQLIADCDFVLAVHGCGDPGQTVFLGGKEVALRGAIERQLALAEFKTGRHPKASLQGTGGNNVCNRGRSGLGVQLEIERGLRNSVVKDRTVMRRLVEAVQTALRDAKGMSS